jgi:hypothetical protein
VRQVHSDVLLARSGHTVTPRELNPLGIAFVRDRFNIPDLPAPMLAAVVTVPASELFAMLPTNRMPAALE